MDAPAETPIYLDHHATTPVAPEVLEAMLPFFSVSFGNPSAVDSDAGRDAATAVEKARRSVAALIGAKAYEVVFTSGATEANNLALLGTARALADRSTRRRVLTTPIEHKAVLEPMSALTQEGFELGFLPVLASGLVDVEKAAGLIDDRTLLVSVQMASNEIGTLQPVDRIARLAHQAGALFHTDAAQAVGGVPVHVDQLEVDMLSTSAHKFYGPKGAGALYLRGGAMRFPIRPLMAGGDQERSVRPGTLNVPCIVGMGVAADIAKARIDSDARAIAFVRDRFEERIMELWPGVRRNGRLGSRLPNNSSLTFPGVGARALLEQARPLQLSTGSACRAGVPEPSHVLRAIGLSERDGNATIRVGFGRGTDLATALFAAQRLADAARAASRQASA